MQKKSLKKRCAAGLALALAFSLGSSSLVQAGTVYELYEIVEGEPSDSGYIPAYDPAEEFAPADGSAGDPSSVSPGGRKQEQQEITGGTDPAGFSFDDGTANTDLPDPGDAFSGGQESPASAAPFSAGSDVSVFSAQEEPETPGSIYTSPDLPVRYSLVDAGMTTPVKNQGTLGICWAFSALESIETGMIKRGLATPSISLSETHLAYSAFHGRNQDPEDPTSQETFLTTPWEKWTSIGGNKYHSTATLARGYGAAYESQYPLSLAMEAHSADQPGSTESILDTVITDQDKKTSVARLKNCYWLYEVNVSDYSLRDRASRINGIKNFIMNYGAVEIGIYTNSSSYPYDKGTNSFYSELPARPNHSVTLVGWDDEKVTPAAEKGAFLVQNSWGTDGGENGFYWLSYEDRSMQSPSFYEMENEPVGAASSRIVHQYDGTGYNSVIKPAKPSDNLRISGANVFTSRQNQYLNEVSFYAGAGPLKYTISIYRYVNSTPNTGTLVHQQSGSNTYSGYYTVPLTEQIPLAKGEKFAVQLTFDNKNGYVPHEGGSGRAHTASPGESFLFDGETWVDMTDIGFNCNICIKAIGTPSKEAISMAPSKPEFSSVKVSGGNQLKATVKKSKEDVDGYDFVLGTSPSFLKTRDYLSVEKNVTGTSANFSYVQKDTYYLAVHSYRLNADGIKVFSPWSDVYTVKIQGTTPGTPKIKTCKTGKGSLTATYTKASNAYRYEYVLAKKSFSAATYNPGSRYKTYTKRKYGSVKLTGLSKGTYYFGVRAYSLLNGKTQVKGKWVVKKITIK